MTFGVKVMVKVHCAPGAMVFGEIGQLLMADKNLRNLHQNSHFQALVAELKRQPKMTQTQ